MRGGSGSRGLDSRLFRVLGLSVLAALATIALKVVAWLLTGSVGLLSDAAESVVNLVAAMAALALLYWASLPADEEHAYGHAKAEYFSAGIEGALIVVASVAITVPAVDRLLHPQGLSDVGLGLGVSVVASTINLAVGLQLLRTGRAHGSITLEADGRHLLTDVWTSVGVLVGVAAVAISGWDRLDGIVAIVVAANILRTGVSLMRRAAGGLMDRALDERVLKEIDAALVPFRSRGVQFHALRTRQAGQRAFVSVHVLVPGAWSVQRAHDVAEEVEAQLRRTLPSATVFTHLEPAEDPRSFEDATLDRTGAPSAAPPTAGPPQGL
ncbi:MAG TPA: cation diffusion facilitator family transporter [Solirubrobacteraceae bacterium]|jgi:cation diffusion facilitator family transporter|nr:cation diffusion facilitator family transporter [Solirubrobacteraceae bacterium]